MGPMPYDTADPRAQLSTAGSTPKGIPRPATYRQLHQVAADEELTDESRTWWTRSQAMVTAWSEVRPGDALMVEANAEYALLVLEGAQVRVEWSSGIEEVHEDAVVVVPPGTSTAYVDAPGTVVRIFAAALEPELAAGCANGADYASSDPNVAEFVAWPASPAGDAVRVYPIADYPTDPGRLGRIFRCSTVMVNVFDPHDEPRDPTKMSPHHHDDFEQVSLQVDGDYVHHMRVVWTPDMSTWRDDEHEHCEGPSVVVIPPPIIHTSQAVGHMRHYLIDVFAPPRFDFSEREGWVLNADEYPMP